MKSDERNILDATDVIPVKIRTKYVFWKVFFTNVVGIVTLLNVRNIFNRFWILA